MIESPLGVILGFALWVGASFVVRAGIVALNRAVFRSKPLESDLGTQVPERG